MPRTATFEGIKAYQQKVEKDKITAAIHNSSFNPAFFQTYLNAEKVNAVSQLSQQSSRGSHEI